MTPPDGPVVTAACQECGSMYRHQHGPVTVWPSRPEAPVVTAADRAAVDEVVAFLEEMDALPGGATSDFVRKRLAEVVAAVRADRNATTIEAAHILGWYSPEEIKGLKARIEALEGALRELAACSAFCIDPNSPFEQRQRAMYAWGEVQKALAPGAGGALLRDDDDQ